MSWMQTGVFNTPASGSTVITLTDGRANAKGVYFFATKVTADASNQIHASMMHGFDDGTNRRVALHNSDQTSTTNTNRDHDNTVSIFIKDPVDDSEDIRGVAAMNSGDVTITWTGFVAGHRIHYCIFGGSDCQAHVNSRASDDATPDYSAAGFTPTLMICATHGSTANAGSQHAYLSIGATDGTNEFVLLGYAADNQEADKGSVLDTNSIVGQMDLDFADWLASVTTFISGGFTIVNVPVDIGGGSDVWDFLLLDMGAQGVEVGTFTKSTATAPASQSIASLPWTPQGYLLFSASETGTSHTGANNDRESIGGYDELTGVGHSCIQTAQHNDGTDAHSRSHASEVLELTQDIDTDGILASATPQAITDATPDIEWNPNNNQAYHIGYIAIEEEVSTQTVTPSPVVMTLAPATPTLVAGEATLVPAPVVMTLAPATPTLMGAVSLTPSAVLATLQLAAPTLVAGEATLTPSPVVATFASVTPTLVAGGAVSLTPSAVVASFAVVVPTLVSLFIATPSPVVAQLAPITPVLVAGVATLTPSAVVVKFAVAAPTVVAGAVALTPSAVVVKFAVAAPTLTGVATLTPTAVVAKFVVAAPTLTGVATLTPNAVVTKFVVAGATLVAGTSAFYYYSHFLAGAA